MYQLSDICEYAKGKVSVSSLDRTTYISTENMLPNKGGVVEAANLPSMVQTQAFEKNDVLVSNIRPYFKKIWYADKNGGCSNDVLVFRAKKGVDPEYLYYVLANNAFFEYSMATSKGTKMPRGDKKALMEFKVPEYDTRTQRKIANVLGPLDKKIKINNMINKNLEQQAQATFKSWFVDFEPFGGIQPNDWNEVLLGSITSLISRGIAPKYVDESEQIIINQKCIRNHSIDLSLSRTHTPKTVNEKWLQYGDILINSTGTGTLGRVAQVLFEPKNLTVDSHVTIVRPAQDVYIFYLGLWGTSHELEIEALHTGSTGQTELPRERVKTMPLLLPDEKTLQKFNAIISSIAVYSEKNQAENRALVLMRDTLLPKFMSGELDIS